jgi:DNA-directed RNA polymerase subunit M/transcription elongation factor TFIIS
VEFAGNRQPCSECGKPIRLPSYIPKSQTPNAHSSSSSSSQQNVIGSIALSCPVCQNQIFAKADQIGQEILCENCLESIVVETPIETPSVQQKQPQEEPAIEEVQALPTPSHSEPTEAIKPAEEIIDLEPIDDLEGFEDYNVSPVHASPTTQPEQPPSPVPTGEFELVVQWNVACQTCNTHLTITPEDIGETVQCPACSGPVTIEAPTKLPTPTRRRIDVTVNSVQKVNSAGTKIATKAVEQPAAAKPAVEYEQVIEWAVVCPVCYTAVVATLKDIDSTVACPDCFKPLNIERPNPMPAAVQRIKHSLGLETATEQPAFNLSASPSLREQIGRDSENVGSLILEQAEQEYEQVATVGNKSDDISWLQMLLMIGINVNLLSRVALLAAAWIVNVGILRIGTAGGDQPAQVYMMFIMTAISLVVAIAISIFAFPTLINVVRQTAYGDLEITEWPPFDVVDWLLESLIIYVALGTAAIPAALLYVLFSAILPESLIFIPLGLAILVTAVIFPFTILSIFENNRFYLPFSRVLQQRITRFPELLVKFAFTSIPMIVISMLTFPVALKAESFVVKAISITIIWVCVVIYSRNIGIYTSFLTRDTDE